jgi:hypothetical protein
MKPIDGHLRRAQHAKATCCVTAEFRIADDIRPDLRHGIFSRPGQTFSAIVRFSNSPSTFDKDGTGTARGLAIKLQDVAGTRAIDGDGDRTQDFLMVDHPVFPFPNPKARGHLFCWRFGKQGQGNFSQAPKSVWSASILTVYSSMMDREQTDGTPITAPAVFLFATKNGTTVGWNPA